MRIVVTGKKGQLAQALIERSADLGATILPVGRPELDLGEPAAWRETLSAARPDVIVSAAAYTAVDQAESEPALAHAVNGEGPRLLAIEAAALGVPLIQISTDYVFNGAKTTPWTEEDTPDPISVYGASKLAGERAVLAEADRNVVLRVGWVYSPFGANFVKTMLRLAAERDVLRVVQDQVGGPTSAFDIADGVLAVARNIVAEPERADLRGVFHMAPQGEASWADFAREIFDWLAAHGGRRVAVEGISTSEYPTKARRPMNSRLDSQRLARIHNHRLPEWRTSLVPVLQRLISEGTR